MQPTVIIMVKSGKKENGNIKREMENQKGSLSY